MRLYQTQTNFSSGEVEPLMHFRSDTGAYANGAARLRNGVLYATGGVGRRAGTIYKATLAGKARCERFEFSATDRYIMLFMDSRLDIYGTDGSLVTSITTGVPWVESELFEIAFTQSADTVIFFHSNWMPMELVRTGASTFTFNQLSFKQSTTGDKIYQPYFKFADDDVSISVSGTTGSVTVSSSHNVFTSDMVGERIRWKKTEIEITGYTDPATLTGTVKGTLKKELINNPFRTESGSATVTVSEPAHGLTSGAILIFSGCTATGGIAASALNGSRTITVIDDNSYSFTAGAAATESIDGGGPSVSYTGAGVSTREWSEQAINARNGYPACGVFHEARLWMAGTGGIPNVVWGSQLYDFKNFEIGDGEANEAIAITIGGNEIANIRHMISNGELQIFSTTSEFFAPAPSNSTLTPSNITIRQQSSYGISDVRPVPFDSATLFVQSTGTAVREFIYNDIAQRYTSNSLSVIAGHVLDSPKDIAALFGTTKRSEQYAYIVNSDGTIALFHSSRAENLAGWTSWSLGGEGDPKFISVCTVGGETWFVIERHGTYTLEKLSIEPAYSLDSVATYTSGTPTMTWTVDSRFYNKTVSVTSGDYYIGDYAVDGSGNMTIDVELTSIEVGYSYPFEILMLPIDVELGNGKMTGRPKRVSRVFVAMDSTLTLDVEGQRMVLRQVTDDFSIAPSRFSGVKEFRLLGFQRHETMSIEQDAPLPVTVLGVTREVQI